MRWIIIAALVWGGYLYLDAWGDEIAERKNAQIEARLCAQELTSRGEYDAAQWCYR